MRQPARVPRQAPGVLGHRREAGGRGRGRAMSTTSSRGAATATSSSPGAVVGVGVVDTAMATPLNSSSSRGRTPTLSKGGTMEAVEGVTLRGRGAQGVRATTHQGQVGRPRPRHVMPHMVAAAAGRGHVGVAAAAAPHTRPLSSSSRGRLTHMARGQGDVTPGEVVAKGAARGRTVASSMHSMAGLVAALAATQSRPHSSSRRRLVEGQCLTRPQHMAVQQGVVCRGLGVPLLQQVPA
jgi:hypothetical protein